MRSVIRILSPLVRICSCFRMKVEILPKIQALPTTFCTLLSSLPFLTWSRRQMIFVSWKHQGPEGRSENVIFSVMLLIRKGFQYLLVHQKQYVLQDLDQEPVVKRLTSDPVKIKDNHFSHPLQGSDSSRGALNFPIPEVRYLIKEISVIWHLYGGKDFGSATFTASPSRSRG